MAIKLRTVVKHPGRIDGDKGISVEKENGVVTVALDLASIADTDTIPDQSATSLILVTPGATDADPDLVQRMTVDDLLGELAAVTASRQIISGLGLDGGGDLSSDRTLAVGAGTGISVFADAVALDESHVRNVDHASVTLAAGAGLTGGGDISASRSFAVGAGTGITVNADDVALAPIADDRIMANVSGSSGPPTAETLSTILDATVSDARGTILVRGASTWSALPLGATDEFLKSNGTDLIYSASGNGNPNVFRPEDYGAQANNSAFDNASAFQALAAAVQSNGGGIVEFEAGADYTVWPVGVTPVEFATLFAWTDLVGVRVNFNGARIITPFVPSGSNGEDNNPVTNANARNLNIFSLTGCSHMEFNDPWFEQTNDQADWHTYWGTRFFYVINGCKHITWNRLVCYGGHAAIEITRNTGVSAGWDARGRDLQVLGADMKSVLYGIACVQEGDCSVFRGIKARNCGRSVYVIDVNDQKWDVEADNSGRAGLDDFLLSCSVDSTRPQRWNTLANIDVKYRRISIPGSAGVNSCVALVFAYVGGDAGTAGGHVRNINVQAEVRDADATTKSTFFRTTVFGPSGATESNVARGHVVETVDIEAVLIGSATSGMEIFSWYRSQGLGGNTVRDIDIDLTTDGAAGDGLITVNCNGVPLGNAINISARGAGFLNILNGTQRFTLKEVVLNSIQRDGVHLGVGASHSYAAGGSYWDFLPFGLLRQGGRVSTAGSGANATFTFPITFRSAPNRVFAQVQDNLANAIYTARPVSAAQGVVSQATGSSGLLATWEAIGEA